MDETENLAKAIADQLGRDWSDCGAYERQSFLDEATRQLAGQCVEDFDPSYDSHDEFYL